MDVEVNLKPMRLCCPKDDPDKQGCDQSWPSCEDLDDDTGSTPRPTSYCGPIPPELDEWEPCPENRDHFCDNNSYRCALTSCNDAITSCAPLVTGKYSAKSHTQPVFSYSKWKGGYLESLPTSPDDPPYGLADCSLIRAIAYHIDQTQSGDEVLIAIAGWSDVAWVIARAVELAKKRGVTVRAISGGGTGIVDWASTGPWVKGVLEDSLGSDFKHWKSADEHKPFKWQISHNKFVLIHKKASNQHMVLITGANWARFDIARNCDLLTLESKPIWSAFRIYWLELFAASSAYSAMYASEFSDPQRGLTVLFWPVLGGDWLPHPDGKTGPGNPFYKIVNKYKKQAGTKIRIICSAWDEGAPGKGLLRELKLHKKAGSDVRVIGNHLLDRGCHAVSGCKKQPNTPKSQDVGSCETTNFIWDNLDMETADGPPIPWAKCAPHSKVLLVSGIQTEDNKFHQAVYTGSLNISPLWTMPDALVGVHDDPLIFSQYEEWWKWLCSNTAMNKGGSVSVCGPLPKKGKKG